MFTLGNLPPPPTTRGREEIGPNSAAFSHIYTSCLCTSVRLDGGKKERKEIHHFLASEGFACLVSELNTPLSSLLLAYTPSSPPLPLTLHFYTTVSIGVHYVWRYDLFLPSMPPPRPLWGPQKDESSVVMWAFGGKVASEGLHLPHTTSLFKRDSAQRGGGEGSKISLPSTPTPNMGEWESFILYLTSRCLSGFWLSHQQLVTARSPTYGVKRRRFCPQIMRKEAEDYKMGSEGHFWEQKEG